ncbi:uncharacterized protein V2V93DRAFT_365846 [Kockiozyma suomiensis]|uniref:uncharacterized protein n=1 Tax=Kockiozyma suomiensis TaxID=1337062 RepID=UPI003343F092
MSTKTAAAGPQLKYVDTPTETLMKDLNRLPLFMTELDTTDGEGGSNMMLEALQALAYEGTPVEVSKNFKVQGNECFQGKQYRDAVEFYTKAIMTGLGKQKTTTFDEGSAQKTKEAEEKKIAEAYFDSKVSDSAAINLEAEKTEEDLAKEKSELSEIVTACYLNRAACNLELKNYRRVINDCAAVLQIQPTNAKAYYRTAKACLAIDKISEAQECVDRGLKLEPKSTYFKELGIKIFQRENYLLKLEQQETKREVMAKHVVHI